MVYTTTKYDNFVLDKLMYTLIVSLTLTEHRTLYSNHRFINKKLNFKYERLPRPKSIVVKFGRAHPPDHSRVTLSQICGDY